MAWPGTPVDQNLYDPGSGVIYKYHSDGPDGRYDIVNSPVDVEFGFAASPEAENIVAVTDAFTTRAPFNFLLQEVRANVNEAPTGGPITVDINVNGATILSTKLTIDATEKTSETAATPPVISLPNISDDDEITIDIDGVGSTTPGQGLKIWMIGVRE